MRDAAAARGEIRRKAPPRRRAALPETGPQRRRTRGFRQFHGTGRDPLGLGKVVGRLVAERGWSSPVAVGSVMAQWPALVGPEISAHCTPESFDGHHPARPLRFHGLGHPASPAEPEPAGKIPHRTRRRRCDQHPGARTRRAELAQGHPDGQRPRPPGHLRVVPAAGGPGSEALLAKTLKIRKRRVGRFNAPEPYRHPRADPGALQGEPAASQRHFPARLRPWNAGLAL